MYHLLDPKYHTPDQALDRLADCQACLAALFVGNDAIIDSPDQIRGLHVLMTAIGDGIRNAAKAIWTEQRDAIARREVGTGEQTQLAQEICEILAKAAPVTGAERYPTVKRKRDIKNAAPDECRKTA